MCGSLAGWNGKVAGEGDTLIDNKMSAETEVFSFLYHEMEQLRSTFASETILKEHNDGKDNPCDQSRRQSCRS